MDISKAIASILILQLYGVLSSVLTGNTNFGESSYELYFSNIQKLIKEAENNWQKTYDTEFPNYSPFDSLSTLKQGENFPPHTTSFNFPPLQTFFPLSSQIASSPFMPQQTVNYFSPRQTSFEKNDNMQKKLVKTMGEENIESKEHEIETQNKKEVQSYAEGQISAEGDQETKKNMTNNLGEDYEYLQDSVSKRKHQDKLRNHEDNDSLEPLEKLKPCHYNYLLDKNSNSGEINKSKNLKSKCRPSILSKFIEDLFKKSEHQLKSTQFGGRKNHEIGHPRDLLDDDVRDNDRQTDFPSDEDFDDVMDGSRDKDDLDGTMEICRDVRDNDRQTDFSCDEDSDDVMDGSREKDDSDGTMEIYRDESKYAESNHSWSVAAHQYMQNITKEMQNTKSDIVKILKGIVAKLRGTETGNRKKLQKDNPGYPLSTKSKNPKNDSILPKNITSSKDLLLTLSENAAHQCMQNITEEMQNTKSDIVKMLKEIADKLRGTNAGKRKKSQKDNPETTESKNPKNDSILPKNITSSKDLLLTLSENVISERNPELFLQIKKFDHYNVQFQSYLEKYIKQEILNGSLFLNKIINSLKNDALDQRTGLFTPRSKLQTLYEIAKLRALFDFYDKNGKHILSMRIPNSAHGDLTVFEEKFISKMQNLTHKSLEASKAIRPILLTFLKSKALEAAADDVLFGKVDDEILLENESEGNDFNQRAIDYILQHMSTIRSYLKEVSALLQSNHDLTELRNIGVQVITSFIYKYQIQSALYCLLHQHLIEVLTNLCDFLKKLETADDLLFPQKLTFHEHELTNMSDSAEDRRHETAREINEVLNHHFTDLKEIEEEILEKLNKLSSKSERKTNFTEILYNIKGSAVPNLRKGDNYLQKFIEEKIHEYMNKKTSLNESMKKENSHEEHGNDKLFKARNTSKTNDVLNILHKLADEHFPLESTHSELGSKENNIDELGKLFLQVYLNRTFEKFKNRSKHQEQSATYSNGNKLKNKTRLSDENNETKIDSSTSSDECPKQYSSNEESENSEDKESKKLQEDKTTSTPPNDTNQNIRKENTTVSFEGGKSILKVSKNSSKVD